MCARAYIIRTNTAGTLKTSCFPSRRVTGRARMRYVQFLGLSRVECGATVFYLSASITVNRSCYNNIIELVSVQRKYIQNDTETPIFL